MIVISHTVDYVHARERYGCDFGGCSVALDHGLFSTGFKVLKP